MTVRKNAQGFSLIELAIGLLIIGIIVTPMITAYGLYIKEQMITTTQGNITDIKNSMERYVDLNGCYPLPGTPGVASTNAAFGQEAVSRTTCTALTAAQSAAIPLCAGNDMVMCQTATGTGGATVYIGDVPFAALGLPHESVVDGFGSKMTYAVSAPLTAATSFTDTGGVIIVHDNSGGNTQNGVATAGNIQYIVVSHGRDKVGAFSLDGVLQANCGAVAADNENCNNDALFSDNYGLNGTGASAVYSRLEYDAPGATHYDDYVGWTVTTVNDLWIKQVGKTNILNSNSGNIRVGLAGALPPNGKVDVRGAVMADQVWTNNLCDATAGCAAPGALVTTQWPPNVFTPDILAATPNAADAGKPGGGIYCNSAMAGIQNSNEVCNSGLKVTPGLIGSTPCPAGYGVCGINPGAGGTVKCRLPGSSSCN